MGQLLLAVVTCNQPPNIGKYLDVPFEQKMTAFFVPLPSLTSTSKRKVIGPIAARARSSTQGSCQKCFKPILPRLRGLSKTPDIQRRESDSSLSFRHRYPHCLRHRISSAPPNRSLRNDLTPAAKASSSTGSQTATSIQEFVVDDTAFKTLGAVEPVFGRYVVTKVNILHPAARAIGRSADYRNAGSMSQRRLLVRTW